MKPIKSKDRSMTKPQSLTALLAAKEAENAAEARRSELAELIDAHLSQAQAIRQRLAEAEQGEVLAVDALGRHAADEAVGKVDAKAYAAAQAAVDEARKRVAIARDALPGAQEAEATVRGLEAHLKAADAAVTSARRNSEAATGEVLREVATDRVVAYEAACSVVAQAFAEVCVLSDLWSAHLGKDCGLLPPLAKAIRLPALRGDEPDMLTQESHAADLVRARRLLHDRLGALGIAV